MSFPASPSDETPPFTRVMIRATAHLLRPLARVLLARGVMLSTVIESLKAAYVEAAETELARRGEKRTDSRVSVMTGVHRKDVRRLREADAPTRYQVSKPAGVAVSVIARWLAAKPYARAPGAPEPLSRDQFDNLVSDVSTDVRAATVLEDLQRLKFIEADEKGLWVLTSTAYTPGGGEDMQAWYFGHNLHDHMAAAAHNISGDGDPMVERAVHYSGLSAEAMATLRKEATDKGQSLLFELNALALSLKEAEREKVESDEVDATGRMALGVYYFETSDSEAVAAPKEPEQGSLR